MAINDASTRAPDYKSPVLSTLSFVQCALVKNHAKSAVTTLDVLGSNAMTLPAHTKLKLEHTSSLETLSPRFAHELTSLFQLQTRDAYKTIKWLCIGYMSGIAALGAEQSREAAMEALLIQEIATDRWMDTFGSGV